MGRRRRVALAVDESQGAMRAVRYAAQTLLTRARGVVFFFAHTLPPFQLNLSASEPQKRKSSEE